MNATEVTQSEGFKKLVTKRWTFSFIMLAALFVIYYGYVFLISLNKPLMATKVGTYTTLGIVLGIAVIIAAWFLTIIYVVWANKSYDPDVEKLKNQLTS